jgi:hypothetical protein
MVVNYFLLFCWWNLKFNFHAEYNKVVVQVLIEIYLSKKNRLLGKKRDPHALFTIEVWNFNDLTIKIYHMKCHSRVSPSELSFYDYLLWECASWKINSYTDKKVGFSQKREKHFIDLLPFVPFLFLPHYERGGEEKNRNEDEEKEQNWENIRRQ